MTYYLWNNLGSLTYVNGDALIAGSLNGILKDICPPIGTISQWTKLTFTPQVTLPTGWVECNGQTLSDANSPLNGQIIPNLNGSPNLEGKMLIGSTTSGLTGGTGSHLHTGTTDGPNLYTTANTNITPIPHDTHTHTFTTDLVTNYPPYYTIKFIMRVK